MLLNLYVNNLSLPFNLVGATWLVGTMFAVYGVTTAWEKGSIIGGFFKAVFTFLINFVQWSIWVLKYRNKDK